MLTVYGDIKSGNCYKVKLVLAILAIEHRWHEMDILQGDTQDDWYLAKHPFGKIPLIETQDGKLLSESNAIIGYLAEGSGLIPDDPFVKAQMYQWMFFEQYSHEPYIAVARFIQFYLGMPDDRLNEYIAIHKKGYKALDLMEHTLKNSSFLVGEQFTLADIALFAYTHVAHQGGFDLSHYPAIKQWLVNVEQQSGFVGMMD
ncbi:glutathione S-transferase family protein [Shewanella sp. HL-SH8]|uniref:glutathione S-transferase family protein n=1 Tax=Shewanella sp. HL-SH8 TaxID=3436242 RepID=UPI003EB7D7CD